MPPSPPLFPSPIYLLPGLAADEHLFAPLMAPGPAFIPGITVPRWIKPVCSSGQPESLESYAARMADALFPNLPISTRTAQGQLSQGRFTVGGFCFGGMVAMEMAAHLASRYGRKADSVLLMCGVRSRFQFTIAFSVQQKLGARVPGFLQRPLFVSYARFFAHKCNLSPAHTQLLVNMAKANDPTFLKWCTRACINWGLQSEQRLAEFKIPIFHIHGARDTVIPLPPQGQPQPDVLLPDAGHLITFTHSNQVADAIREQLKTCQDHSPIHRPLREKGY